MKKLLTALLLCIAAAAFSADAQQPSEACPAIKIEGPTEFPSAGGPLTLNVTIDGREPDAGQTFNWTLSAGTITRGQGTSSIEIDTEGLQFSCLNVSAELAGRKDECPRVARWASLIGTCCADPRKFDEYGNLSFEDEQADRKSTRLNSSHEWI